jgi:predicted dehydrogenase
MEKPLATDPVGIRKVLATAKIAKAKKLNVVVGLQRHYESKYIEIKKRIDARNAIGKSEVVRCIGMMLEFGYKKSVNQDKQN